MAVRETAKRRRALAELLVADGSVQIAELAAQYHVSRETIRKDLIFLEQSGVGRRSRGGSLILEGIAEPPLSARSVENIAAKHRIAEAAVRQIPDGATILLDTGSTMNEAARLLALRHGLTIVTNSAQITPLLADSDNTVYALGGQVRATSLACVGMWTLTALRTLRADIALIGTNGVLGHTGPCTSIYSEAEIKTAMVQCAKKSIVLCDGSKFREEAVIQFADWQQIDCLITDQTAPEAELAAIRQKTTVLVAGT